MSSIAREMLSHLSGRVVQGVQLSAPFGKYAAAMDVLEYSAARGAEAGLLFLSRDFRHIVALPVIGYAELITDRATSCDDSQSG